MFGYLVANPELLTEEQLGRYKSSYCGLCRSLKERHGQLSRLTLTYDLTFLVLLLDSLYEPESTEGAKCCPAHPFRPRRFRRSEISDYAADMNAALAYLKCMDDWDDDLDPLAKAEAALLRGAYRSVCADYPRQCGVMESSIKKLRELESRGEPMPDEAAEFFAAMMGEIFVYRPDHWENTLRTMGRALGRFLYVLDACMDLEEDRKKARYNPFSHRFDREDNGEYFSDILKMLLSDCVAAFDRLPLVQDADILKNVLCSGLWMKFREKYGEKKGTSDVSGSV